MRFISATEAKQTFGTIINQAQREPITIQKKNRNVAVIMSIEDYQRITKSNMQEFQQFRANIGHRALEKGLTEDKLQELLADD